MPNGGKGDLVSLPYLYIYVVSLTHIQRGPQDNESPIIHEPPHFPTPDIVREYCQCQPIYQIILPLNRIIAYTSQSLVQASSSECQSDDQSSETPNEDDDELLMQDVECGSGKDVVEHGDRIIVWYVAKVKGSTENFESSTTSDGNPVSFKNFKLFWAYSDGYTAHSRHVLL